MHPVISPRRPLRLLSFNVQAGIDTRHYHQYVTQSWRHILPDRRRQTNLDRIAGWIGDYDIVGLQEVDGGSLRSGFINQSQYLAHAADFPFWRSQTNRNLGRLGQHGIALLSRAPLQSHHEHRLPGPIPGRGALMARFGAGDQSVAVYVVHLALGRRTRQRQLDYLAEQLQSERHAVLMGDFNCTPCSGELERLIGRTALTPPSPDLSTFPSWAPRRHLDHILATTTLTPRAARVLPLPLSDHLPIALEIDLPSTDLPAATPRQATHTPPHTTPLP